MAQWVKNPPIQCRRHRRLGFNPWVMKIPWRRACNPYPLQYSCLENTMGRVAWQTTVCGVSKSWTRLKKQHMCRGSLVSVILTTFSSRIFLGVCVRWIGSPPGYPRETWCQLHLPWLSKNRSLYTWKEHWRHSRGWISRSGQTLSQICDLQQSTRSPFILNQIVCAHCLTIHLAHRCDKGGPAFYFILKQCSLLPRSMGHAMMCPFQIPTPDKSTFGSLIVWSQRR